jgi:hypothetical protein
MRAGTDRGGPDVAADGEDAATDASEAPAAVGGGDAGEDVAALHPQNSTREASTTPQPVQCRHTCRNQWLSVWLRYIGPAAVKRPFVRKAIGHVEQPSY